MGKSKRLSFLLLGFLILLLSSVIACGSNQSAAPSQPSFITYTNDDWGYAINYPSYWRIKVVDAAETDLIPPLPYRGFIGIRVVENPTVPFEIAVEVWVALMRDEREGFSLLDSRRMQGLWDWYISYDFVGDYGKEFHGETYFKQTGACFYKVDTVGEKTKYDAYAFGTILSTFKLLPE